MVWLARGRAFVFPFMLLGALELWARTIGQSSDAVAPPTAALAALFKAAGSGELWLATGFTLLCAGLGLTLAMVLGVVLGTVLGLSNAAARWSFLSVELLRPIPSVAIIPLAMLIFGFGLRMEVLVITFACFWPILVLAQGAAQQIEPRLLEVARALQLSPQQQFMSITLPAMLPRLFVALRLGVAVALVVAVTVEIAANPNGMGYAMVIAQQSLEPALMLGWLLWIGIIGFAINAASLRLQVWVARRMGELPDTASPAPQGGKP